MRREQVLRLPVVNSNGEFQGILSINDVVLDDENDRAKNKESLQTFFTLAAQSGPHTLLKSRQETPCAFDENGYSPVERVFNEQQQD